MRLPSGKTLRFEVRIGEHAVSKQIPQPPRSGLIQVNLDSGDTRVVVAQLVEAYPDAAREKNKLRYLPLQPLFQAPSMVYDWQR